MRKRFGVMLLAGGLLVSGTAMAEQGFWAWLGHFSRQKEVQPVTDKTYADECGSCHYAYPPGLLPGKSWAKLLDEQALNNHFGENAALDPDTLKTIRDYALANAAEKSWYKRSRKIVAATEDETPLRITEVRYIRRKHHDIPAKMIQGNKDVKSLSYCNACHTQAERGIFDSDTVSIPNYPDWD